MLISSNALHEHEILVLTSGGPLRPLRPLRVSPNERTRMNKNVLLRASARSSSYTSSEGSSLWPHPNSQRSAPLRVARRFFSEPRKPPFFFLSSFSFLSTSHRVSLSFLFFFSSPANSYRLHVFFSFLAFLSFSFLAYFHPHQ